MSSPELSNKVSIVGIGSVGTAIAYACLIRGSVGSLALYDINAKKLRAELLDLNHGSQFVPHCPISGSDDVGITAGSTIVIVTAGAKQDEGQSRLDLATANVAMAQSLTPQLLGADEPRRPSDPGLRVVIPGLRFDTVRVATKLPCRSTWVRDPVGRWRGPLAAGHLRRRHLLARLPRAGPARRA